MWSVRFFYRMLYMAGSSFYRLHTTDSVCKSTHFLLIVQVFTQKCGENEKRCRKICLSQEKAVPLHPQNEKHRGVEQLVARQAHNLEVACSSPASATLRSPILIGLLSFCYGSTLHMLPVAVLRRAKRPLRAERESCLRNSQKPDTHRASFVLLRQFPFS